MSTDEEHSVIIVGGGPAGVNAALECVNNQLDTILLEAGPALGGQLPEIPFSVRNVATGWYASGKELQSGLQRSAELLEGRVRLSHPASAAGISEGWVEADGHRFRAKAILIASGTRRQPYPQAADGAFGGDVTYQLETRPDGFAGRTVVVVGGGDSGTLDALELAGTASSVLLVHRSQALTARNDIVDKVRADHRIEDLPGWEVEAVCGGDRLEGVVLVQPSTGAHRAVEAGGLVVKISRTPNTDIFRGQVDLDRRGYVTTDDELRTSCPGVFAAGDVVAGAYWRVAYALGQGMLAARSIERYMEAR